MKRRNMIILAVIIVLVAAGTMAYRTWASSRNADLTGVQTATVERGSLSSTLGASGNSRSGQSATISWETSGKVGEISLQAGEQVQEDQVLAALDSYTLNSDLAEAKLELINAQQSLDDLLNSKTQQAQALQAVEEAQIALDDLKRQAAEEASRAQLALANAQEAYDDAVKTRNAMNYPHSSDKLVVEKAETDYLLAKAAYKEALKEYKKYEKKNLTNQDRVRALNNLVTAEQLMDSKFATYNWYLMDYTETDIAQADADVAVALANLESAQADWDRLKNGASEAAVALAEAQLADAQREYERVKNGPTEADIEAGQAAVDAVQASLDAAQLLAPFSGTITEVDVSTGDLVSPGDTAFRIDDLSNLYIDLQISEVDLASLAVGQQAIIEFDAIEDKQYTGEITEIGLIGTNSQGVVNYPVTVRITDADSDIRTGMTASVSIITAEADNVLLVPNKAIHTSNGQKSVTVLFEGQQISVPVTAGLVSDSMTEITSSQLREGDTVVTSTTSTASTTSTTSTSAGGLNNLGGTVPGGDFGGPPPNMP
jgi:HlyD family secretion protein